MAPIRELQDRKKRVLQVLLLTASWIGWILALASQSLLTYQAGNTSTGFLWFPLLIQLSLNGALSISLRSHSPSLSRLQISLLATMVVIFAALGIHVHAFPAYFPRRPASAVAAIGWAMTLVVHLFWMIIFSSDAAPSTFATTTALPQDDMGTPHLDRAIPPTILSARQSRLSEEPQLPKFPQEDEESWSNSPPHEKLRFDQANPVHSVHSYLTVQPPRSASSVNRSTHASSNLTNITKSSRMMYTHQAKALEDYTLPSGEGYEELANDYLSFQKGDVMEIVVDPDHKWWEAKTSTGRSGLVPSNYMRVLSPLS